jgi:amidase
MSISASLSEGIGDTGLDAATVTAGQLSQALAAGTITAAALAGWYLDRIERLNPGLRAVISVSPDALVQAAHSDARRAAGAARGPLDGLPVLIKDNLSMAGAPATAGSPALAGAAGGDAFCLAGLRAAGAVLIGKANLSEWANFRSRPSSSGWSTLGGQAVNPHGAGRNPSGSSSGSAVAVAAGLAPLAIGTETDGSIVSPAAACGVVGIKPTVGLISRSGIVPISAAQDTAGPMGRTVADAALLLGALTGRDAGDPASADAAGALADYSRYLDSGALDGARIGVWRAGMADAGARSLAVLEAALDRLRAAGARLTDPVELPDADKIGESEFPALTWEFRHEINAYLAGLPGEHPGSLAELIEFNRAHAADILVPFGQEIFEAAQAASADPADADALGARTQARRLARAALDAPLAGHGLDAVISLTGAPAWLTDHILGDHHTFGTSTPAAVSGYPAITVPAGDVGGLPVGLSFMGLPWTEPALIGLAHAFEQAGR